MNINESSAIIDSLADAIINDDRFANLTDDTIDALADCLTANAFRRLLIAIDLCPFHRCDIAICADDDLDCLTRIADIELD
jgi:hypothetical protein